MVTEVLDKQVDFHPLIHRVGQVATGLGVSAYIVGGYVRDLILGRNSKDIDFVCLGSGIRLAEQLKKELGKKAKLAVYKNFGTAAITYDGYELEFVGARKESYRADSRKPIVEDLSLIHI